MSNTKRWIKPVPGDGEPYCPECHHEAPTSGGMFPYYIYTPYCPWCGAKLDGPESKRRKPNDT